MSIAVLVVDDQPLFCSGIQLLLEAQPDLEFAGAAHSGNSAIAAAASIRPDVVLMDLRMPDGNGVMATHAIASASPTPPRVLILTTFRDQRIVQQALQAGASGFITKDATPHDLLQAIRNVATGRPVSMTIQSRAMLHDPLFAAAPNPAAVDMLTPREREIFLHVARGMTNSQIADVSHITENTVRTHVSSLLQKLGLTNRAQAAAFAHREGLLPTPLRRSSQV